MKRTFALILLASGFWLLASRSEAGKTNIVVSVGDTAVNAIPAKNWTWLYIYCADSPFHVSVTGAATTSSPKWPAGSVFNVNTMDQFDGPMSFIRSGSSNMTIHAIGYFSP